MNLIHKWDYTLVFGGRRFVEAAAQGAEEVTKGMDAFEGRKEGMGVMEADARDALGGWGGLVMAAAQGAEEGEIQPLMAILLGEHDGAVCAGELGGLGRAAEDGGGPDRGGGRV